MKKQKMIINIEDAIYSELNNHNNYVHENNALYLGTDHINSPKYKVLLPDYIKELNNVSGSFVNKMLNVQMREKEILKSFIIDNEIYNNIFEHMLFLIKKEIDRITRHPVKLSSISSTLNNLTDIGYDNYMNDITPRPLNKILKLMDKFIGDDEWNFYTVSHNNFDLTIVKNQDWRILEWERMTAPKEE